MRPNKEVSQIYYLFMILLYCGLFHSDLAAQESDAHNSNLLKANDTVLILGPAADEYKNTFQNMLDSDPLSNNLNISVSHLITNNILRDFYVNRSLASDSNAFTDELKKAYSHIVILPAWYIIDRPELIMEEVQLIKKYTANMNSTIHISLRWDQNNASSNLEKYRELSYRISDALGLKCIPSAMTWAKMITEGGFAQSHPDNPSEHAKYTQACTLYSYFVGEPSISSYRPSSMTDDEATLAKELALTTVQESQTLTHYSGFYSDGFCATRQVDKHLAERISKWRGVSMGTSTEGGTFRQLDSLLKGADAHGYIKSIRGAYFPESLDNQTIQEVLSDEDCHFAFGRYWKWLDNANSKPQEDIATLRSYDPEGDISFIGYTRHYSQNLSTTLKYIYNWAALKTTWKQTEGLLGIPNYIGIGRAWQERTDLVLVPDYDIHLSDLGTIMQAGMIYTVLTGKNGAEVPGYSSDEKYVLQLAFETVIQLGHLISVDEYIRNHYPGLTKEPTLKYLVNNNGSISGETFQTLTIGNDGSPVKTSLELGASGSSVMAIADENYHFVEWSDGVKDNPRTDTNVTSDKTVTALFAKNTYTVTFLEGSHGQRVGGGELIQTIDYGNSAQAPAIDPADGYLLSGWDLAFDYITESISVKAQYSPATPFVMTTIATDSVTLPFDPVASGASVDWGDGNVNQLNTHTYSTSQINTITITGPITGWKYNNANGNTDIATIVDWGEMDFETSANAAFRGCSNLNSIPLDRSPNTSLVIDFDSMFRDCSKLDAIPPFNTSNGKKFSNMFRACSELITIPYFDTTNGESCGYMFFGCSKLTLVPPLDTSKVKNFASMFRNCEMLRSLPLFNFSLGTNFTNMFNGTALSTSSYDTILSQFVATGTIDEPFSGGDSKYSSIGENDRDTLVSRGWNISDGGLDESTPIIQWKVTFDLGSDGSRIGGGELYQIVNDGASAFAPVVKTKSSKLFTAWDINFDSVNADLTIRALYSTKQLQLSSFNMTNPSSHTLSWTALDNTAYYYLAVGTSEGMDDLYGMYLDSDVTTVDLNLSGYENVYVRLWTYANGEWHIEDSVITDPNFAAANASFTYYSGDASELSIEWNRSTYDGWYYIQLVNKFTLEVEWSDYFAQTSAEALVGTISQPLDNYEVHIWSYDMNLAHWNQDIKDLATSENQAATYASHSLDGTSLTLNWNQSNYLGWYYIELEKISDGAFIDGSYFDWSVSSGIFDITGILVNDIRARIWTYNSDLGEWNSSQNDLSTP